VRLLCIDEIHKHPHWQQQLKNIADIYFEIGGKNKSFSQLKHIERSYIFADGILSNVGKKLPLHWLGFLC